MKILRSWQFSFAVFLVIAIAAIVGIIFGVTGHREPAFMPEGPLFISPRMHPPDVCVRTYSMTLDDGGPMALASDRNFADGVVVGINRRLGFEMYRMSDSLACDVIVTFGVPAQQGWQDPGGSATLNHGQETCDVDISNVPTDELRWNVLEHELGHCMGLAHDEEETSIMRRVQRPVAEGEYPPRISDSDRDTLRHVYGGQW
jgi:hypothetical protein